MAAAVGKFAANKLLSKQMEKYKGKKVNEGQDPYFALVEDPRRPGKLKKVKKQIPAYIPEHDANILAAVRRRSYRLDMCLFDLFGIRFGWEAVIGIIPAIGDAIGVFFALLIFKKCCQVEGGLNGSVKMRMLLNIAIDFAVGLVPFVGDLADAAFKCNTKNLRLLESELDRKHNPRSLDERDLAGVDPEKRRKNRASGIYAPQDPPPATAFEEFSDDEEERRQHAREQQATERVREPQRARTRDDGVDRQASRRGYGWFHSDRNGRTNNKRGDGARMSERH